MFSLKDLFRSRATPSSTPTLSAGSVASYWRQPADQAEKTVGHKDVQLAFQETKDVLSEMDWVLNPDVQVLNLGAGNPDMVETFSRDSCDRPWCWVHMDTTPKDDRVLPGNALATGLRPAHFHAVLAKRLFCCLPPDKQLEAALEIHRITAPNGYFFLADVFSWFRDNLQKARVQAGLPELPAPQHNFQIDPRLSRAIREKTGFSLIKNVPLAGNYLLWTRLLLPMLLGRDDPFTRVQLRIAVPAFDGMADELVFHRLYVFKKVRY